MIFTLIQVILLHTIKIKVLNNYAFIHLFKKMFHKEKMIWFCSRTCIPWKLHWKFGITQKKNLGEEESRNSMNTINIPDFIILIIYIIQSAVKCLIKVKMKVNNCRYFNINFNIQMWDMRQTYVNGKCNWYFKKRFSQPNKITWM